MNAPENPAPPWLTPPVAASAPPRLPWGFWATGGLGLALMTIYVVAQTFVVLGFMVVHSLQPGGKFSFDALTEVSMDGDVLSSSLTVSAPLTIFFVWLFIKLRHGPALGDYLGLHWPRWRAVALWGAGMGVVMLGSELLMLGLNRPTVPEVMLNVYRTAAFKPLLWLAIIVVGPVVEGIVFRGFLFRGWQESRLRGWGTIALTSLLWAAIHLQYDIYGVAIIFAYGIFLGLVRLRTGSLLLCAALHCGLNLMATIQVELYLASN